MGMMLSLRWSERAIKTHKEIPDGGMTVAKKKVAKKVAKKAPAKKAPAKKAAKKVAKKAKCCCGK
jgi:hypothetical protein